jgi:vitellogenic carboxypeptidase-like protein
MPPAAATPPPSLDSVAGEKTVSPLPGAAGGDPTAPLPAMMWLLLLALAAGQAEGLGPYRHAAPHNGPPPPPPCTPATCGEPLFLTPLIKKDPAQARKAAAVSAPLPGFGPSFSGLVTTDEASGNALFFWYMPPLHPVSPGPSPTIMWLQGGPGAPSTYGMFTEIGPVIIEGTTVSRRNHTWNNKYGLLIVDNPAGVGFSRLGDVGNPVATEVQVGRELTELLRQTVAVFPEMSEPSAGIFIAGESYGGKYAPAAAWTVNQANLAGSAKIPLRGLIIGDGWCDPASHVPAYAPMLRGMGLLDTAQFKAVSEAMARSTAKIDGGDFPGAIDGWNSGERLG